MIFKGKVVAITGAAGGIGQSLCRYFAGQGAHIAAIDKSPSLEGFMQESWKEGVRTAHAVIDIGDEIGDAVAILLGLARQAEAAGLGGAVQAHP